MPRPTKILRSSQTTTTTSSSSIATRQPPSWAPRPYHPENTTRIASPRGTSTSIPRTSPNDNLLLHRGRGTPIDSYLNHLPTVWFNANFPLRSSSSKNISKKSGTDPDHPPPDDRKLKLGKTLRILQESLPTLLQTPLPQEVLSPNITLHLFPSTHPHLPVVTGRVAYIAALWSSPIAWNRVPIVGNVRLEILSERMVAHPVGKRAAGAFGERLVVRWRTAGKKTNGTGERVSNAAQTEKADYRAPVGDAQPAGDASKEFTGLFFFDFDVEGRILSHTIEHVQEGGQWEKGVGAKVVGLTDWLLGGMKGPDESPCPAFTRKWR